MKSIFSIDVEDWFHILDVKSVAPFSEWDSIPSRVERNFIKLLDIFSENKTLTTCFFLGWIAEKYPDLVKEAYERGHEIASHGYKHDLIYNLTPGEFYQDAVKTKDILENIISDEIIGYRAAGFSNTENTPWFFDKLIEAGYKYDSSLFPMPRHHGGMKSSQLAPFKYCNDFIEFPISLVKTISGYKCFFGGGYIRHNHYFVIKNKAYKVLNDNRPVIFYVHPREIDPKHPRLKMNLVRYIKSYGYLNTTEIKIKKILKDFKMTTFKAFISENCNYFNQGEINDI
ncbi:MAG: polysaccharide deacetylase family protein [Cyanobacteriota bacterium]